MTEEYVMFTTAKLLNEAGFDAPTRSIYRTNRTAEYSFVEYNQHIVSNDLYRSQRDGYQYEYLAPPKHLQPDGFASGIIYSSCHSQHCMVGYSICLTLMSIGLSISGRLRPLKTMSMPLKMGFGKRCD